MKALLLIVLLACSPPVAAREPSRSKPLPFCMRVLVRHQGAPVVLAACAESAAVCEVLRELARRRGGLAGIEAVGSCK